MNEPFTICSVVLAGGQGRRVNGGDKGLMEYQGMPLVEHALKKVNSRSQQLIISCNRNLPDYEQIAGRLQTEISVNIVTDASQDYFGPLAGLLAASEVCEQQWLFTLPCDMPDVPDTVLSHLCESVKQQACDIAVCHDGQRRQNLLMLARLDVTSSLQAYLHSGGRRVDDWQNQFQVLEVDFSAQQALFNNLNRLEDF